MMAILKRFVILLVILPNAQTLLAQRSTLSEAIYNGWATDGLWDDGNAEIAEYKGERIIYGEPRSHTCRLITVKEDFNTEYYVKADWPYGQKPILTTLKQNQVATIETPNYPYHFMTSVFFDRNDVGDTVKMSVSSQEWCGLTFKEYQLWHEVPIMSYSSYWDGEGTGERGLPDHTETTLFEEELPLIVRALNFEDGLTVQFGLQPNQTTTRAPAPRPAIALLVVKRPPHAVETAIGPYTRSQAWVVTIETDDNRALEFLVEADYPNRLLQWSHSDGRNYQLQDIRRWPYWRIGAK